MTRSLAELDWPVHTDRLEIRPARAEDAAEIWAWRQNPVVGEWISVQESDPADYARRFGDRLHCTVVAIHSGHIIATGKIVVTTPWVQREVRDEGRDSLAEFGWILDPAYHGQGFGREFGEAVVRIAFEGRGVHRIVGYCAADNIASWKVMEKIGIRREGYHVKDWLHRTKGWLDSTTYAMLAEEWFALHPGAES